MPLGVLLVSAGKHHRGTIAVAIRPIGDTDEDSYA
jgi:hypothetical protein